MPCYHPLTGYYSRVVGKSGKRQITFQRSLSLSGAALRVPCGRCAGCRLEKSRQWAMRILHEKRLHKESCFVTLTYDDAHLPPFGTLVKRDLSLFMKRLRNECGSGVRFYGCGEYGDLNKRPHYHVILFNYSPSDKLFYKNAKRGEPLYNSASLSAIWGAGFVVIGDVTFDSAAYVARYVMKKRDGKLAHTYDVVDGNGEIFRREPEFSLMSRRPGIGLGWFAKYGRETYAHDSVVINGKLVRPPRYYDGKYELENPQHSAKIKKMRKRKAHLQFRDNLVDRRRVKERVLELNLKQLKRNV
ncbi:MAG: replication initiator protein [Microviridae sp.]|nr:MAG: replication initiator protein [Microviridae sp.]